MIRGLGEQFGERYVMRTLFIVALVAHFTVYFALLWFYGPCSFFISYDCTTSNNDVQHYPVIAYNISHGEGYSRFADPPYEPDALRTPLLPLYFAPFTFFGGLEAIWLAVLLLNIVLALAGPLSYKLARLFLPHGYALVLGVLMSIEPLYVYRSQVTEPDALFVLGAILAIYFLLRSWRENRADLLYGAFVVSGFMVLAKPTGQYTTLLLFLAECAFALFFAARRFLRLKHSVLALLVAVAIVSPWLIRNKIEFGVVSVSTIQGYGLYEYFTAALRLPGERVPEEIQKGSREPSRYPPYERYFTSVAVERIKAHPVEFMREHLLGMLRNMFVSDIAEVYYYGHTKLLPFPYNPESKTDLRELVLRGQVDEAFVTALRSAPKLMWISFVGVVYVFAVYGWYSAWRKDRVAFLAFTLFFAMYGYFLFACGLYVDAKYRLPVLPLVCLAALYGLYLSAWPGKILRSFRN